MTQPCRRLLLRLLPAACLALFAPSVCAGQGDGAQDPPSKTTPLPRTTTLEARVNPTGLSELPKYGWHTDFIGPLRGDFDFSVGIKFWPERLNFQNVIFGGTVDLLPGFRLRAQVRREEGETHFFQVEPDEFFLEAFTQYRAPNWNGGLSLKAGHVRYLHFPYPDAIAQFDQVPDISDLDGTGRTSDYRTLVLQSELALNSGWGLHFGGKADLEKRVGASVIEAYGFYRQDFGRGWRFEGRLGALAVRRKPLGRPAEPGGNIYLGKQIGEFNVGILYEHKQREHEFAGIMVQFRPGAVTRALGKVNLDYSRTPEGFTAQIPVWHGRLNQSRFVRSGDILVGEVRAVRMRTLWEQGFVRNQYEHRLASWGETSDPSLRCVVTEEPWYLQAEALISPHLVPDARWERDRQGPGQFVQRVTYRFYRPFKRSPGTGGT